MGEADAFLEVIEAHLSTGPRAQHRRHVAEVLGTQFRRKPAVNVCPEEQS